MAPDVAIVGGGVIGCAIAYALAGLRAGRILVIDRGAPGAEASNAAAGVLAVGSSRAPRGVLFELRRASAGMFPAFVEQLQSDSGIDVEYRTAGLIDLAFTDDEAEQLRRLIARRREQGFPAEELDAAAVAGLEPAVNPSLCAAGLFRGDR